MRDVSLPRLRETAVAAAIAAAVSLFALVFAATSTEQPLVALAVPALGVSGAVCYRWPAVAVTGVVVLSATFGSLAALGFASAGPGVDLLLGGLWASVFLAYALKTRERPLWVWPGLALTIAFIVLTFFEIFTALGISLGLLSFKYSTWYLMCVPLLAVAGWQLGTYVRISRALVTVAAIVGAYAVFRLIVGPSDREAELAFQSGNVFNTVGGELSLLGSFTSRHELAFWATCAVPVCVAAALVGRGGALRVTAAIAVPLCITAVYGTDVRAALPALVAGSGIVIALNVIAGRGRGTALAQAAVAALMAAVIGAGLFAVVVGEDSERYEAVVSPSGDTSYEQRMRKWEAVLADVDDHPLGFGLATAGRLQQEGSTPYVNTASYNVDSAYLKIAYEQGFPVLALFLAAMLALLVGLARRAVQARSREVRALAIGATGALASALVMFVTGQYMENLASLFLWLTIGAAIGALGADKAMGSREPAEPAGDEAAESARGVRALAH